MIALQVDGIDAADLYEQLAKEVESRLKRGTLTERLPTSFELTDEQRDTWQRTWAKATRQAPITFDDAMAVVNGFLSPILSNSATGIWNADSARWE